MEQEEYTTPDTEDTDVSTNTSTDTGTDSFSWVTNESEGFSNDGGDSTDTNTTHDSESDFGWIDKETPTGLTEVGSPDPMSYDTKSLDTTSIPTISQRVGTTDEDEEPKKKEGLWDKIRNIPSTVGDSLRAVADNYSKAAERAATKDTTDEFTDTLKSTADEMSKATGKNIKDMSEEEIRDFIASKRADKKAGKSENALDLFDKAGTDLNEKASGMRNPKTGGLSETLDTAGRAKAMAAEEPTSTPPTRTAPVASTEDTTPDTPIVSDTTPDTPTVSDTTPEDTTPSTSPRTAITNTKVPYYSGSMTDQVAQTFAQLFVETPTGKDVDEMNNLVKQYNDNIGRGITDVANEVSARMTDIANTISQNDSLNDIEKAREFASAGITSAVDTIKGIVDGTQVGVGVQAGIQAIKVALSSLAFLFNWPIQLTTAGIKMFLQDHATELEGFIPIKNTFDYIDSAERQSDIRTSGRLTARYNPHDTTADAGQSYNKGLTKTYSDEDVKKFLRTVMSQPHIRKFALAIKTK